VRRTRQPLYMPRNTARSRYTRRPSEARRLVDGLIIQLDLATRITTGLTITNCNVDVVPEFPTTGVWRRGLLFNSSRSRGLASRTHVLHSMHQVPCTMVEGPGNLFARQAKDNSRPFLSKTTSHRPACIGFHDNRHLDSAYYSAEVASVNYGRHDLHQQD
jgi:hypothetical protein